MNPTFDQILIFSVTEQLEIFERGFSELLEDFRSVEVRAHSLSEEVTLLETDYNDFEFPDIKSILEESKKSVRVYQVEK